MLAAAPARGDRALESFRLFLALKSQDDAYSGSLRDYFVTTLQMAKALLEDPETISQTTPPEAVSLAVQFLKDQLLREVFDEIDVSSGPTPQQADRVLKVMENSVAFNNQPAHFAEGVYSTF